MDTPIGVMADPLGWTAISDGHLEGLQAQNRIDVAGDGIAPRS